MTTSSTLYQRLKVPFVCFTGGLLVGATVLFSYQSLIHKPVTSDTTVISSKLSTMTVKDAYETMANKQIDILSNEVLNKAVIPLLEDKYGKKVTSNMVDTEFTTTMDDLVASSGLNATGSDKTSIYKDVLASQGHTIDSYKAYLREELLLDQLYQDTLNAEITDAMYEEAFKTYIPETEVVLLATQSENVAQTAKAEAAKEGADFETIATNATELTGAVHTLTSSSALPPTVIETAYKQDAGVVSDIIKDESDGYVTYYMVQTIAKAEKPGKWQDAKDDLRQVIVNEKGLNGFLTTGIQKLLAEYEVEISDPRLKQVLAQYFN